MADLLSYTGDAALGLGSNPNIPAIPDKDNLAVINQTGRDLMLLDNERNLKIFQQKISDRDSLARMIMDDKVSTGDILPAYQGHFDSAKKRVEEAFFKWKGNFNDTAGFNKYKEAVQQLKDVAGHAQTNTVEIKKLQQQQAGETLPKKKADMQRWIDQQSKQDFWNPVVPYQQLHDLNMDTFGKFVQPVTSVETPDKAKPYMSYDVTRVDFGDIQRRALNGYINDLDQANDIEQLLNKFQNYNQPGLNKALEAMNGQIEKYNQENGYAQGDSRFVLPIKTAKAPNGATIIAESQVDFAAKYALANQQKYLARTPKFSKDLATYDLGLKRLDLAARKLGIEGERARAYVRNLNAKTEKYFKDNKDEATSVIKQYNDFVDNMQRGGISITHTDKRPSSLEDAVFLDEMPQGYQLINGPVLAMKTTKDKKGNIVSTPTGKITIGQLEPFVTTTKEKRPYYIPRYVNSQTGQKVSLSDKFFKEKFAETKSTGKYPGLTYDDYIRTLLKKGAIEMVLQGKNGAANFTSMSQSAKLINAQTAKKGGENVINPPESVMEEEQDLEEP
jgi:hypothetical protein